MKHAGTVLMIGIVSGVAVWAITNFLEEFEALPEEKELHTKAAKKARVLFRKNIQQFKRREGGML